MRGLSRDDVVRRQLRRLRLLLTMRMSWVRFALAKEQCRSCLTPSSASHQINRGINENPRLPKGRHGDPHRCNSTRQWARTRYAATFFWRAASVLQVVAV